MRRTAISRRLIVAVLWTSSALTSQAVDAAAINSNHRKCLNCTALKPAVFSAHLASPVALEDLGTTFVTRAATQLEEPGFSKDFMRASIEATGAIKVWRSRLAYGIQHAYPGDGSGLVPYRDRASEALRLATAAASTASDENGAQLLTNYFNNVDQWANKMIAARKSMDATMSMSPSALYDDPLFQNIQSCAEFLGPMLASGKFSDDASCH